MARRYDQQQQQQQQLHYASILPASANANHYHHHHHHHDFDMRRRSSEQERTKALYLDFEDAFQDENATNDYFGFQSSEPQSHQPTNFHLQSVEMISEIKNTNFSPNLRYQASRETSHSSSTDTPPYPTQYNHRSNLLPPSSHHQQQNLHRDFTNLDLNHNEIPAPFTPNALRMKVKKLESNPMNLPQYFLVKYLGRSLCTQLWGAKAVRTPIDEMVRNARQLPSMNEVPTLEVCVNARGLTLTHRQPPIHNKNYSSRMQSPERYQHGLIPLENISYAMHDIKYSKIASCIVLRQIKTLTDDQKTIGETLTECYAFLFQSKDHAHRFALALAEAFNVHKHSSRNSRPHHEDKREGRSPQRRSRHRNGHHHHHHHRTRSPEKYKNHHLKDSKA